MSIEDTEGSRKRLCIDDVSVQSADGWKVQSMPLETKENICRSAAAVCEILDSASDVRNGEEMDFTVEPLEEVAAKKSKDLTEDKSAEGLKDLANKTSSKVVQESEIAKGLKRKLDDDTALKNESDAGKEKLVEKSLQMDKEAKILVEEDVGITEFISEHAGFSGTIKQRLVFYNLTMLLQLVSHNLLYSILVNFHIFDHWLADCCTTNNRVRSA